MEHKTWNIKHDKAFTLIELLVVLAIIGLLASIVFTALGGSRERAKIAKGLQFSASIHNALGAYAAGVWNFNEGSGSAATDMSGNNNDGTISGAQWRCASDDSEYTPSGEGCSLEFNGSSDYVDPELHINLNNGDAYTFCSWSKFYNSEDRLDILGSDGIHWMIVHYDTSYHSRFYARIWDGSGICPQVYADNYTEINKWHHICQVIDRENANKMYLYVDGGLKDNTDIPTTYGKVSFNVYIGGKTNSWYFNGLIDEVRIYKEALSSAQIEKHYTEGLKRHSLLAKD